MDSVTDRNPTVTVSAVPAAAAPPQPAASVLAVAACSCGRGPHPTRVGLCAGGHPLPGQGAALSRKHGLYESAAAEELARARREFVAASVADDGGPSEVPTRRHALHEYRGRLHTHIAQLSDAIDVHGLFDRRGRLRSAWLQHFANLVDRARAIDQTLGLQRREKHVDPLEAIRQAVEEANR